MGRLCVPLLLLLAAAVAVTAVATNAKSSPPRVVGFWLVDVATGAWRRRLTDGASIGEPPGTYTIAALSSAGRRLPVVFVEPASYARTERVAPYVAAGKEARSVQGMTLPVGAATVSAYVAGGGGEAAATHNIGAAGHCGCHPRPVRHGAGGDAAARPDAHRTARPRRAVRVTLADAGYHADSRCDGTPSRRGGRHEPPPHALWLPSPSH